LGSEKAFGKSMWYGIGIGARTRTSPIIIHIITAITELRYATGARAVGAR
jgi:hypothetical protein